MEEKIHVFPKIAVKVMSEVDKHGWTKGVLVMTCHNCGNEEASSQSTEFGVQLTIPVNNHDEVRLFCSKCNSMMSLHFVKADDGERIPNTIIEDDGSEAKVVELYPKDTVEEEDEGISRESAMSDEAANELIDELTEESTEA